MKSRLMPLPALLMAVATCAMAQTASRLDHRVWLLRGLPESETLVALRSAGVDGLVLPVGRVDVEGSTCRFTMAPTPDLKPLAGWNVAALVWAAGRETAAGDAGALWEQLAPVNRMLPGRGTLILAARAYWAGLPKFASAMAKKSGQTVEIALGAQDLQAHLPPGGWPGVRVLAVAFGNPAALGFTRATLQDDLAALEAVDACHSPYRVAIVVEPDAKPAPGSAGASLAMIARGEVASYRPGEHGDLFTLKKSLDWGGTMIDAGQTVAVEAVDTARYHRDLGLLMRPVRTSLVGWETVGLPPPEPSLGMSRSALLDYFAGEMPYPAPRVEASWGVGSVLQVAMENLTPHASALSTQGNWIELQFTGTEVRDVQLGDFAGTEYGRSDGGVWRRTRPGDATAVRLYLTYVPPRSRVGGAIVSFLTRPKELLSRWGLVLGDGSAVEGSAQPVSVTKP